MTLLGSETNQQISYQVLIQNILKDYGSVDISMSVYGIGKEKEQCHLQVHVQMFTHIDRQITSLDFHLAKALVIFPLLTDLNSFGFDCRNLFCRSSDSQISPM